MSSALHDSGKTYPGLDPLWSHVVSVPGRARDAGAAREWHFLDSGPALESLGLAPVGTILAVHGNPTWSYLWRALLAQTLEAARRGEPAWRVIAVDQLDMGFSQRTGVHRPLTQRVADLTGFTDAIGLDGPVVSLGHDWGGVISLGWAVDHPGELVGVATLNTAVHHPAETPIPFPLRVAGARGVLKASTVGTPAFLSTTLGLAAEPLDADVEDAYRAPYRSAARRHGIGGFVADIPVDARHPSFAELQRIAAGVAHLEVPALLLWGPEDPIFGDRYLDDLIERMPHADVHRFEGAGHLLAEDRPYAETVISWLAENHDTLVSVSESQGEEATDASPLPSPSSQVSPPSAVASPPFAPLWQRLDERRGDDATAVIDMTTNDSDGAPRRVSWRLLHDRTERIAAGLQRIGVRRGDRISLLIPPGPTLTAVVYACLRIGAVVVVADAGLGVGGLTRAVRGAWPDVIIGESLGLTVARAKRWPGLRISTARLPRIAATALGVSYSLADLIGTDPVRSVPLPEWPQPGDPAAILFTSGSTGPAKGVVYTHAQLSALRDVLGDHFDVTAETGLVTGFAPFALLGPALGTLSVTPDMDVSAPRTLTATAVAAAVRASGAQIVFLSPAAVANVSATSGVLVAADVEALAGVRTFLSTGAPIGTPLLESAAELMPNASAHTPYGMTECLLMTDVTLAEIRQAHDVPDSGVLVGSPIGANLVRVSALDADGLATGKPNSDAHVLGEIVISAPHLKNGYDRLWLRDREAVRETASLSEGSVGTRWHRTGDVGHLDDAGRLWIEGRLQHVIVASDGPIAPVGPEQQVEAVAGVRRAAVVGVGPHGLRQAVAVIETDPPARRPGLADSRMAASVRAGVSVPIVAVLVVPTLPTDIRHNSKIDRSRLSVWAERMLSGEKPTAP